MLYLDSFIRIASSWCVLILVPFLVFYLFPMMGLRTAYLTVLFAISTTTRSIHFAVIPLSSFFIDVIYGDLLGVTYVYSIVTVYVFCDYVNMACILDRSFNTLWAYFAVSVVIAELLYILWIFVSGIEVTCTYLLLHSILVIASFPLVCSVIGVMLNDE